MELIGPCQIFSAGTYPSMSGTEHEIGVNQIDEMISNFEATPMLKVPLVIGHSAPDDSPALGYIQKLRRVNNSLFAWFADVPQKVQDAITQKRYSNCSVELNLKSENSRYAKNQQIPSITGIRLERLAILGSTLPAVGGMAALDAFVGKHDNTPDEYLMASNRLMYFSENTEPVHETYGGDPTMSHAALVAKQQARQKQVDALNEQDMQAFRSQQESARRAHEASLRDAEKSYANLRREAMALDGHFAPPDVNSNDPQELKNWKRTMVRVRGGSQYLGY